MSSLSISNRIPPETHHQSAVILPEFDSTVDNDAADDRAESCKTLHLHGCDTLCDTPTETASEAFENAESTSAAEAPIPECSPADANTSARGMSPKKMRAILALAQGASLGRAAELAEVDPSTLYRWTRTDPNFQHELRRRHEALYDLMTGKAISLADYAFECMSLHMQQGNLQACLQLLKGIGLLNGHRPEFGVPAFNSDAIPDS